MILLLIHYDHKPIVPKFLFMAGSMFGVASPMGVLAFDSHYVQASFVQVASSFARAVHVVATPFVGSQRGISS